MTIVAGFLCKDGIVLCADQQISSEGHYKYYERKILIHEQAAGTIAFAYSGLPSLAKEAKEKMVSKIRTLPDITGPQVLEIADEVLTDMGRHYADINLQLLIGTSRFLETPTLAKFDGKGLHTADNFNCLGVGDSSMIRYLSKMLYSPQIDVETGASLGAYLIQKAENHIDHCGGQIDVLTLTDLGFSWIKPEDTKARISKIEKQEGRLMEELIRSPFSSSPTLP